jgi:CHAT domain-containing protein/Tfp pilus assembly protein PilF
MPGRDFGPAARDRSLCRQVTTYLADELSPDVDPAGRKLIFTSNRGGNRDIWMRPLLGGLPVKLTDHSADDFDPAFSPDGKQIAFASHRLDAKGDIFLMRANGSGVERLTDRRTADRQPAWFPDGQRLAHTGSAGYGEEAIFVLDLTTRETERLTRQAGFDPAVSPDGRFLLFTAMVEKGGGQRTCLWVQRLEDGREEPLHACDYPEAFGTWAQAGDALWVVFSRFYDDTNKDGRVDLEDCPGLWKTRFAGWSEDTLETGPSVPLTPATTADITSRVFGRTVYYASRTDRDLDIWSVPLSGSASPVESFKEAERRVEHASTVLDALFVLRRGALELADSADSDLCRLREADLLLRAGYVETAARSYAGLSQTARQEEVRNRALLGHMATRMEAKLPVGMSPTRQAESRSLAVKLLEELEGIQVPPEEKVLLRADVLRRVGKYTQAFDALAVIPKKPAGPDLLARALLIKGEMLQALGNTEDALSSYLRVLQQAGVSRSRVLSAADHVLALAWKGRTVEDPVERLEGIARKYPDLPVLPALVRVTIGDLHQKAGRRELARRSYREVEERFPREPEVVSRALLNLSVMAEEDGDASEALDHANELIDRYPEQIEIHRRARRRIKTLARTYADELLLRGETGMAIKVYRQLLKQEPDDVVAHRRVIDLMAKLGRAREVVKTYRAKAEARPGDNLMLYLYGLALTYLDPPANFDEAEEAILQALAVNSQLAFAHQTLGWIYEQQAKIEKDQEVLHRAAESYQAALGLLNVRAYPQSEAHLLLNLGNVHYALGDYRRAYTFYQRRGSVEIPFFLPARQLVFYEQYGRSAFLSDELDDAVRCFSRAASLAGELGEKRRLPRLVASRAAAYQLRGEHELAAGVFRQACDLYEKLGRKRKLASCFRNVAYNLYMHGDRKQAAREFKKAESLLKRHGTSAGSGRGVSVSLADTASRAAFGFDRLGELNFLYTYQGRLFAESGDLVRAQVVLERKIDLLRKRLDRSKEKDLQLDLAIATNQLAVLKLRLGDGAQTAELFARAYELARDIGSARGMAVNAINRLNLMLTHSADLSPAQVVCELKAARALVSSPEAVDVALLIRVQNAIGVALVHQADAGDTPSTEGIDGVLRSLDDALTSLAEAEKLFGEAHERSSGLKTRAGVELCAYSGWNLAQLWTRLRNPTSPRLRRVARLREDVRGLVKRHLLLRLGWRLESSAGDLLELPPPVAGTDRDLLAIQHRERVLGERIAAAMGKSAVSDAFRWSEKLLCRRRLDAVWPDSLPSPEEDREYHQGLVSRAEALSTALEKMDPALDADAFGAARAAVEQARKEFVGFRDQGGNPRDFVRHIYAGKTATVLEVQGVLEDGEGLLSVVALDDRLAIFLLTREDLSGFLVPVGSRRLKREVEALRGEDAGRAAAARTRLGAWILGPLKERLGRVKSLIAVTDSLQLPLEMLVWKGQALVVNIPVTHIYAASDLSLLRRARNLNFKRVLWVGNPPDQRTAAVLKSAFGTIRLEPGVSELSSEGLVVWAVDFNADPDHPLRSAVGSDLEIGSLGGLSLLALAAKPVRSGLWLLLDPRGLRGSLAAAGLELAMLGARVPTALVVPGAGREGLVAGLMRRTLGLLAQRSPAEALSLSVSEVLGQKAGSWRDLLFVQLRGDAGMGAVARKRYAEQAMGGAVRTAMGAFGNKRWSEALSSFLEVRALATYLGRTEVLPRIDQGIVQSAFKLGELELASEYESKILAEAQAQGDKLAVARAHAFQGVLLSRARNGQVAVSEIEKAVAIFDRLGRAAEAARVTATLALVLDQAAKYPESISASRDALDRFEKLKNVSQSVRMLRTIGTTNLKRLNLAATARGWYQRAYVQAKKLGSDRVRADILLDLARCELAEGSYEEALELAGEAEEVFKKVKDSKGRAGALLERASGLWYLGEYQRAFSSQRKALRYAEAAKDVRLLIMARSLGGLIALNLGDLSGAEASLQKAYEDARSASLRDEEAVQLNNLGIVSRERGDLDQARERFQKALRIDTRLKSTLGRAYDLRNLGIVEQMEGNLQQAAVYLTEALELTRSVKDRFNEAKVLHGLSRLDLVRGNLGAARRHAQDACEVAEDLGLREVVWRSLRTLGEIARREGKLDLAEGYYEKAIELVERMRAGLKAEEFRAGFLDNKFDLYEDMIHLLLDTGKNQLALEYSERSRARGFLDLLANRQVKVGGSGNQEMFKEVRRLKKKLAPLAEAVRRTTGEKRAAAEKAYQAAQQAYREKFEQLRRLQPALTDFIEVRPAGTKEIREQLPDDVALLAYYVTSQDTIGWVIRKDAIKAHRLSPAKQDLQSRVGKVRKLLENFSLADPDLKKLYDDLVRPLEEDLLGIRRVGILPHDVLNYLPFAALKTGKSAYLSDRYRVFSAPSVGVLQVLLRRQQEQVGPAGGLLALGNPTLGDPALDLPFAEKEASAVGFEQPGSDVALRGEATESAFRKKAGLSGYLHLACHGEFNSKSPLFSSLKLAPGDGQDGELTALEVFSLSLSARLVTLSACQTGLGKLKSGDEIIGFNRAFLAAGAGSIVSSLWRVSDVATAVMMKRFYRYLKTSTPLEALHQSQQIVRRYFPHPAYWSGFVLVGTWL